MDSEWEHFVFFFGFASLQEIPSVDSLRALGSGQRAGVPYGKATYFSLLAFSSAAWSFLSRILSLGVIFCTSESARRVCRWICFCLEKIQIPHTQHIPNMLRKIKQIFYRRIITLLRREKHLETGQAKLIKPG